MNEETPPQSETMNANSCQGEVSVKKETVVTNDVNDTKQMELLLQKKKKTREDIIEFELRRRQLEAEVRIMEKQALNNNMGSPGDHPRERMESMISHTKNENHVGESGVKQEIDDSYLPMSCSSMIGMKRKADAMVNLCGEETNPTASEDSSKKWLCTLCDVYCTSEGTLKGHLQGKKHKAKEAKSVSKVTESPLPSESPTSMSIEQEVNPVTDKKCHCPLCEVYATSETLLKAHFEGKKHKAKEAKLGITQNINNVDSSRKPEEALEANKLYCSLCQVSASSEDNLQAHFQGKKHKAKAGINNSNEKSLEPVKMIKIPETLKEGNITTHELVEHHDNPESISRLNLKKSWLCKLCNEELFAEEAMDIHRKSSDHMTRLKKVGGCVIIVSTVQKEKLEGGEGVEGELA